MRKILCIGTVLLWSSFSGHALGDFKDNLVGYWNFDETSGSVAHSLVPLSDDGALFNFPCDNSQWVPGHIGGALHFRGPDYQDYVIATFYPLATDAVSFSGWVNADVNTVNWQSIFKNWGGAHGQFHFGLDATSMTLGLYIGEADNTQIGPVEDTFNPGNFPTGQWVHVGFVADGSQGELKVYFNGQLAGSGFYDGTLLNPPPMTSLGIGVKTDNRGTIADPGICCPGYWQGSFDDFGLWTRVLSDNEMAQIYALGQNGQSFYGQ
jgi:hypothetical protein